MGFSMQEEIKKKVSEDLLIAQKNEISGAFIGPGKEAALEVVNFLIAHGRKNLRGFDAPYAAPAVDQDRYGRIGEDLRRFFGKNGKGKQDCARDVGFGVFRGFPHICEDGFAFPDHSSGLGRRKVSIGRGLNISRGLKKHGVLLRKK